MSKFLTSSSVAALFLAASVSIASANNGNAYGKDQGLNGKNNDAPGLAVSGANGRVDSGWGNGGENLEGNTPNANGESGEGDNDNDHGNSGH